MPPGSTGLVIIYPQSTAPTVVGNRRGPGCPRAAIGRRTDGRLVKGPWGTAFQSATRPFSATQPATGFKYAAEGLGARPGPTAAPVRRSCQRACKKCRQVLAAWPGPRTTGEPASRTAILPVGKIAGPARRYLPDAHSVRPATGEALHPPADWSLLPPGGPALTCRVKTAGPTWTVR